MAGLLFDRQRAALSELLRLIESRTRAEGEMLSRSERDEEGARVENEKALKKLAADRERELGELDANLKKEHRELVQRHQAAVETEERNYAESVRLLGLEEEQSREKLQTGFQDALWAADSVLEAGQRRERERQEAVDRKLAEVEERGEKLWEELAPLLERVGLDRERVQPRPPLPTVPGSTVRDIDAMLAEADTFVAGAQQTRVLRWMGRWIQLAIILLSVELLCVPAVVLRPWPLWLAAGATAGILVAILQRTVLMSILRSKVRRAGRALALLLINARRIGEELKTKAVTASKAKLDDLREQHAENRQKVESRYRPQIAELEQRLRSQREFLEQKHRTDAEQIKQQGTRALQELKQRHARDRAARVARFDDAVAKIKRDHAERIDRLRRERTEGGRVIAERWAEGSRRFLSELEELRKAAERRPLESVNGVAAESALPEGLPLGAIDVHLPTYFGDSPPFDLAPLPHQPMPLPAFLPFPRQSALLLQAHTAGKAVAVDALRALMLRFLTALPPGKVRFTVIDPVGLGDNFSSFMHLADYNESLVTSRIWTEPSHIESQLADITEHMENVIQKYLRGQFSNIEDYNRAAGEVAEPYRVLVVANFPINFTPQAARRLVSIAQSGASCGVYALISADVRQEMPQGFLLEDLAAACLSLRWQADRFVWDETDQDRFPLALETPPADERVIDIVRRIGEKSRDANRVEVPFAYIAPPEEEVWKGDSRRGVSVPLGRAGAVRKMALALGKGTSQHVLVAGKTGSGKSTLWHALIVNLALHYSPEELELYLIDFKKGVEFKMYAEQRLPHARVIAIESEREFGLSVLQSLDVLLRERGDRFRSAGVNDIASYRQARPDDYCPRVLLIVDEFQEFFVEDDRLAQEASLLMDRLVRQGRAFGLHVLLGSQTLGGAYSLARSTIDQMAVRIALQCSDNDAQLMNKDNAAARLLSRPGEAVFNDAGGSLEGNEIFQVVWLSEEERENRLKAIRERADAATGRWPRTPPIVFESNAPAAVEQNPLLRRRLEEGPMAAGEQPRGWLGEAIAIKDPTAAVFKLQSGANLLIVGQNEELALGMLASSFVGLAVQHAPGTARFYVMDGTSPDETLGEYLPPLLEGWPHEVRRVERAALAATLAELAEEMNRRLKGEWDRSRRYVVIHALQRFRDLRKGEDDFGFGRRGAERTVSPAEHLVALLRDGPTVGIHLLMWCDQLTNLNRALDRQALRECGQRVLFQMSAGDSSNLIDTPLASRLGQHRALFFHDEMAQPEKFRPYDLPPPAWAAEIKQRLATAVTP